MSHPFRDPSHCDHGLVFDAYEADRLRLDAHEVRRRFPRLDGTCPKGCGYVGIAYASFMHMIYGDW